MAAGERPRGFALRHGASWLSGMFHTHVVLFSGLIAMTSVVVALSILDVTRKPEAAGTGLITGMTAAGLGFCSGAGLYGALYNAAYVQEISVTMAAVVLFTGLLTALIFK